jgi:hypothetical protein
LSASARSPKGYYKNKSIIPEREVLRERYRSAREEVSRKELSTRRRYLVGSVCTSGLTKPPLGVN